jgi:hypothetical protein
MAQVTLRAWYPPAVRRIGRFDGAILEFDASRTLNAKETTVREQALLRNVPLMMLDGVILLLGCTVLLFGYSSRSRDVLLCGSMIATLPLLPFFLQIVDSRLVVFSVPVYFPLQAIAQIPSMTASVVFIWAINDFSDVLFKRLMFAAMIVFNLAMLLAFMPAKPSPAMSLALATYPFALRAFDVINVGANLWAVFTLRRNRPIAVAMMLIPAASLIGGFRTSFQGQGTKFFDLAFLIFGLYLSAVLAQRAWKEWRTRDTLQAEFETAREMQQRLVGPAVDVPGFRIESVYKPATHVGGDFFYIRAEEQNAVLVVVGDVSGKGLKAAMTVNLVIGALRTMPLLPPTRILTALNRGLVGQMQGGFVTCCAVRIGPDGNAALANAGHLSPYLDGVEVPVNAGLPLGIHGGSEYEESHFVLEPAGYLTFLSDGIVEARSTSGELFGFERTQAISTQSAEEIARAAQEFGQEDDITVLTLTFAPAEVVRA